MIKTIIKDCLILMPIILCLCGCSSSVDLRDRAIIQAMGIDYKDGEFIVSLQEFIPNDFGQGEQGGKSETVTVKGKTVFDALKNAESLDGKQVFYGHCRLFIIGKSTAKNGIYPIIEFLSSNYRLSLNASVLTSDFDAIEILSTDIFSKTVPDLVIEQIQKGGKAPDVTVIDLLKNNYNLDGSCFMPIISQNENGVKIEKCVIFSEGKTKIILDEQETMGLNFIKENVSDAVLTAKCKERDVSVNIISNNSDISLKAIGDKIKLKVNILAKGNISELGVVKNEKISEEHIIEVEKDIKKQINGLVERTLNTVVKENSCDIFYLKQRVKKDNSEFYQKINEQPISVWLPQIEFDVNVDFNIRHAGVQIN